MHLLSAIAPVLLAAEPSTPSPSDDATSEAAEAVVETTVDLLAFAWKAGLGAILGIAIAGIVIAVLRSMSRQRTILAEIARFCRNSAYGLGGLTGAYLGAQIAVVDLSAPAWATATQHILLIGVILAATWLIVGLAKALESSVVESVRAAGDEGRANRVTTQTQIMRRVAEAIIIICGTVGGVMTFPSARVAMGSLLASAGLVSVVAGLAAQSTLGNVFAGIQLATTDAIRVGDVVVIDDEQGTIEEITLTYVVVRSWDDRRVILPSTHFTQNPFANWSRRGTEHTGTLTLDLDWRVPVAAVRAELARIVAAAPAWDGRVANLDVTDTAGGTVTLRIALSGPDASTVFGLQCHVREELVTWMQTTAPYALPRTRVEVDNVEVSHDPQPEQVARLAEELVALQQPAAAAPVEGTSIQAPVENDPIEAARLRAAAKGRSPVRRARRDKVRRRRILARDDIAGEGVQDAAPRGVQRRGSGEETSVISTNEQEIYAERDARAGAQVSGKVKTIVKPGTNGTKKPEAHRVKTASAVRATEATKAADAAETAEIPAITESTMPAAPQEPEEKDS